MEYNLSFLQKGQKYKRLFFVRLRVSWFDKKRFIYSLSNGGPQSEKEKKWNFSRYFAGRFQFIQLIFFLFCSEVLPVP